jgi:hypothetical protein
MPANAGAQNHEKKAPTSAKTEQDVAAGEASTKSRRSSEDAVAPMGVATTNTELRLLAAVGEIDEAPSHFQLCDDVSFGGVLLALPALLSCGLLKYASRFFTLPSGYYGLDHIFILLAFMAMCRIKSIEKLASTAPGEWGKLLGLDRCPATKTMRAKIKLLSAGEVSEWASILSEDWMKEAPETAGVLYIDGHTRVYHGSQTKLPHHYVARQRLCMRATSDYWVNGFDGLPFFKVNCAADPGMIHVIENEIVPRLEEQVPNQPSDEELCSKPYRSKFRLVFDREGYSPAFFRRMNEKRIAVQTYRKYVNDEWSNSEFTPHAVKLTTGETAVMQLAERGTLIGSQADERIWVREIRKRTENGRQIAIVSTEWEASPSEIAGPQFGRWYQENFFKYAREHFNLDRLIDYQTESVDDTIRVINPRWRTLDAEVRKRAARLGRKKRELGGLVLKELPTAREIEQHIEKATALGEQIEQESREIAQLKSERKQTAKRIEIKDLPEEERFQKLAHRSKHFIDILKIIAYRAETAMADIIRESLGEHHRDEARAFIQKICTTEANLRPAPQTSTLHVDIHSLATPKDNRILKVICEDINKTETLYPGTTLRLVFNPVSL